MRPATPRSPRTAPSLATLAFTALALLAGTATAFAADAERPANWAQPVDKSINLYQMSPTLYRSALPSSANLAELQQLKVHTVVSFINDEDKNWIGDAPIHTLSFPTHTDRVDDADVLQVLRALQSAEAQGPVLMHCKHGRDRTGLFSAMYRTVVQGWSKEDALKEMREGGFGKENEMADAIRYVENADIDALRKALADGSCSTKALAVCNVQKWLAGTFGEGDPRPQH